MRLLCDVDGVLGDFPSEVLQFCNRYGREPGQREWTLEDCTKHDILEALGLEHLQLRLDQHMRDTDFCRHMPLYPGTQDFVEELKRVGDLVIVTASYGMVPGWEFARRAWLKEHFGIEKSDVVFCKRKELVVGDVLVDDKRTNVLAWSEAHPSGWPILFDRPWNRGGLGDFEEARGYDEVLSLARDKAELLARRTR